MVGQYEIRPLENSITRHLKKYVVSYVWDKGELTGVRVISNLSYGEAKSIMRNLENLYPYYTKKAVMAKMLEVIV